jgi:hypothetical protein
LPSRIDRLDFLRTTNGEPAGSTALVRDAGEGAFDVDVTDGSGQILFSLQGYRTNPLPVPIGADPFKSLKG